MRSAFRGVPKTFNREQYEYLLDQEIARISTRNDLINLELRSCANDKLYFASRYFKHEDIDTGRIVRLIPNSVQFRFEAEQGDTNIILKSRKPGISTWIEMSILWESIFRPHLRSVVIAHEREATTQLFDRLRFAAESLPAFMSAQLEICSRKELIFSKQKSHIRALTAGNVKLGRGSDIDRLHLSECAFYTHLRKVLLSAKEAMRPGGIVWFESTPNGYNEFREMWLNAKDPRHGMRALFYPWFVDKRRIQQLTDAEAAEILANLSEMEKVLVESRGITADQVAWRRGKIEELGNDFFQEYAEDDESCFITSTVGRFDIAWWKEVLHRLEGSKLDERVDQKTGLVLWEDPIPGHEYSIGADPSEGVPRGDFAGAGILDVTDKGNKRQVAELMTRISPGEFGLLLARLGRRYNNAPVVVERNNHGHATLRAMRVEAQYPHIYRHRELDQKIGKVKRRMGFPTLAGTKASLLDGFDRATVGGEHIVRSRRLCLQCMSMPAEGQEEVAGGSDDVQAHDDLVIAWALADWGAKRRKVALI